MQPVPGQSGAGQLLFKRAHSAIDDATVLVVAEDTVIGDPGAIQIVEIHAEFNPWLTQEHQEIAQRAHALYGKATGHDYALFVEMNAELLVKKCWQIHVPDAGADKIAGADRSIFHGNRHGADILPALQTDTKVLVKNAGTDIDVHAVKNIDPVVRANLAGNVLYVDQVFRVVGHFQYGGFQASGIQIGLNIVSLRAQAVVQHQVYITRIIARRIKPNLMQDPAICAAMSDGVIGLPAAIAEHEHQFVEVIEEIRPSLCGRLVGSGNPDQAGAIKLINLERNRD